MEAKNETCYTIGKSIGGHMKYIIHLFHCLSIKKKLILSFTLLVFLPILILFLFSNTVTSNILIERISDANTSSLTASARRMDRLLDDITFTLLSTSRNTQLMDILKDDAGADHLQDSKKNLDKIRKVNEILDSVPLNMLMYSTNITITSNRGDSYGTWEEFYVFGEAIRKNAWYNNLMQSYSGSIQWLGINNSYAGKTEDGVYALEAAIAVKENRSSLNNIGVIHVSIPEMIVYGIIKLESPESEIFVLDQNGRIISTKDKKFIETSLYEYLNIDKSYEELKNGWFIEKSRDHKKMVISATSFSKTDWKLVSVIPYDKMLAPLTYLRNITLATNLFFLTSFLLVAFFISNTISKPIIKLNNKMKLVGDGVLDGAVEVLYDDEIGNMSRNFNNMLLRINELLTLTKMQERKKREAELNALQAQINPHFLFNTLSSIRWTAAAAHDTKAEEMALSLSNLLKYSINKGPDMITLEEELNMLRHYIDLFQIKQESVILFDMFFDDEMLKVKIPRLLLQPIVENSIIHGFEGNSQDNRIRIEGKFHQEYFEIEISDNGKGIDSDLLGEIMNNQSTPDEKMKLFGSIGINNVDERIKLNFGEEYGVAIQNAKNGGTVVTLTLPAKGGQSHA